MKSRSFSSVPWSTQYYRGNFKAVGEASEPLCYVATVKSEPSVRSVVQCFLSLQEAQQEAHWASVWPQLLFLVTQESTNSSWEFGSKRTDFGLLIWCDEYQTCKLLVGPVLSGRSTESYRRRAAGCWTLANNMTKKKEILTVVSNPDALKHLHRLCLHIFSFLCFVWANRN